MKHSILLSLTDELMEAFDKGQIVKVKDVSNKAIEQAALRFDHLLSELSLIAYALHKSMTKVHVVESKNWDVLRKSVGNALGKAIEALGKEDLKGYEKNLHAVVDAISLADAKLGNYVQSSYDKARVKQASRAYAYGLSLSQAAELTGADRKELQGYIGGTKMHDEFPVKYDIKTRLGYLRGRGK